MIFEHNSSHHSFILLDVIISTCQRRLHQQQLLNFIPSSSSLIPSSLNSIVLTSKVFFQKNGKNGLLFELFFQRYNIFYLHFIPSPSLSQEGQTKNWPQKRMKYFAHASLKDPMIFNSEHLKIMLKTSFNLVRHKKRTVN